MDKFASMLEKFLMPIANAVGRQKHLAAMRDGFIAILPMTLVGATVTMLNWVLVRPDSLLGGFMAKYEWYATSVQPFLDKTFLAVFGQVWWGTLALGVIFSVFTISYNLARSYEVDGLSAGVVATVCYLTLLPQAASAEAGWGTLSWNSFNSSAIFAGLITAFVATEIFRFVTQRNWTIKMPKEVPPAVSKAFSAIIPGGVAMMIFGIAAVACQEVFGTDVKSLIYDVIQTPLTSIGQSPFTYILFIMLSQIFWFFGLHGMNIVGPILDATYAEALQANFEAVTVHGTEAVNVITRNLVDVYGMHGGSGATLGLIIAIFIFSKRQEYRELGKLAGPAGIFQINEPVIYGLPIVLNPLMFLPFVFVPVICTSIGYFATVVGFADKLYLNQAWVMPPVISAFTGTGGDWKATVVALGTFILSIVLYAPFVIIANKEVESREKVEA